MASEAGKEGERASERCNSTREREIGADIGLILHRLRLTSSSVEMYEISIDSETSRDLTDLDL